MDLKVDVLYPPLLDEEKFVGGDYGDYIFAGGRIGPGKRQHLLIEAIAALRALAPSANHRRPPG